MLYLNNDYTGGSIQFRIPKKSIDHNGNTITEELQLIGGGGGCKRISIEPQRGTLLMFDQRLLHSTSDLVGTKYILRTELICTGIQNSSEDSVLEKEIECLTKKLFRQAQYYELQLQKINKKTRTFTELNNKCTNLYEICLSLRQDPSKIKQYPKKLESLLEDIHQSVKLGNCLRLISRNGSGCKFNYRGNNKLELIKISALYSFIACTKDLTNVNVSTEFQNILNALGIISNKKNVGKFSDINVNKKNQNDNNSESEINKKYYDYMDEKLFESNVIYEKYYEEYDFLKYFDAEKMNDKINNGFLLQFSCDQVSCLNVQCQCSLGDNVKLMDNTCQFVQNELFELGKKEFEFKFDNIQIDGSRMAGKLHFDTIVDSFNHASCQCDVFTVLGSNITCKYKSIRVDIEFFMTNDFIEITLCPGITM